MIFRVHTQEGEGFVERHARLFEAKSYSSDEDTYGTFGEGNFRGGKLSIGGEISPPPPYMKPI